MRTGLALVLVLAVSQTLWADLIFQFNYNDPAGQGFNDATQGAARRAALELAGAGFATAFSSYNAAIVLDVEGTATGGFLAAAGSEVDGAFAPGFGNNEVIRNKILSGNDLNGGFRDGVVIVNFAAVDWQLDINTTPTGTEFDWYSTMYHEFTHVMGFSSGIFTDSNGQNASDAFGTTGNTNGSYFAFDQFLTDSSGNSVFSSADLGEAIYEALLVDGNSADGNGLFFDGTNAKAASGGDRVGLYTPATFEDGSSGSHLDDQNPVLDGLMMLAATGPGPGARTFSSIEQGILRDIGYTQVGQTTVPEPSVLLLMGVVVGFVVNPRLLRQFPGRPRA